MERAPLFERLGGREGIRALSDVLVENHLKNPVIRTRYEHASKDPEALAVAATEFFCTGLSGVPTYDGPSLVDTHAGMNISDREFNAVLDDVIAAMKTCDVGELEQAEVLQILYGMKPEIVEL